MKGTIIKLKQLSGGCPEQWEGKLDTGQYIYARERHGEVRIELDGIEVCKCRSDSVLDVLMEIFNIPDAVYYNVE